jgi:hypothetical protein
MADEQKAAETKVDTPATATENEVVISQSKLDQLIDKGFSKGAKRAANELAEQLGVENIEQARELINAKRQNDEDGKSDLAKAADLIATLNSTIEGLEASNQQIRSDMDFQKVASDNGVQDEDYFKHLLMQAQKADDFEQAEFITSLKSNKPYLFGAQEPAKKVDATSNRASLDVAERVKGAKTMAELYALQNEIN